MSTCFMFIYDTLMCCFRSLLHLNMCSLLLLLNPNPHPSSIPTPSVWVCHPLPPCSSLKKFQKQNFASAEPKTGPKNKILACSEGKTAPPPPQKKPFGELDAATMTILRRLRAVLQQAAHRLRRVLRETTISTKMLRQRNRGATAN